MTTLSDAVARSIKANGVHYTPSDLASFLADVTVRQVAFGTRAILALDPACGDGGLLRAAALAVPLRVRRRMLLIGYETDRAAARNAEAKLLGLGVAGVEIRGQDFLDAVIANYADPSLTPLFAAPDLAAERFDVVISNPPYVRTQVLGAHRSRRLAALFGLSGRVDLYHAFVKAISMVLRPGGVLGLLTSNRFMMIQSGASVRELLRRDFELCDLYDLGDTRLFHAAVLPAVLVAKRNPASGKARCPFARVYAARSPTADVHSARTWPSILDALRSPDGGIVRTGEGRFHVDRGELAFGKAADAPWSLSSPQTESWLGQVRSRLSCAFGDVAQVRVGIKTTADAVFIRDDWDSLPEDGRPEPGLLRPLITHHAAARWLSGIGPDHPTRILYPHEEGSDGSRRPVDLAKYPRARAYLQRHRKQLEARRYVVEAGRKWYEIWVPQQPRDWSCAKVVYPDISEQPKFFLDTSGALVNGDCYWITLDKGAAPEWLYLMLAVANSTFITAYYDTVFHNKLYAGRRRFMTQYVRQFPLPRPDCSQGRRIIGMLSEATDPRRGAAPGRDEEEELNGLVWSSFGLREKAVW